MHRKKMVLDTKLSQSDEQPVTVTIFLNVKGIITF